MLRSIEVNSELGKGSVFTATIPIQTVKEKETTRIKKEDEVPKLEAKLKVLVAEVNLSKRMHDQSKSLL